MPDFAGVRVLVFRVGGLVCGAEADVAQEIRARQPTTRIPGAPEAVLGLVNVRGSLVTVVDGRRALGYPPGPDAGPLVLLTVRGQTVGLLVDEVLDLAAVAPDDLADRNALVGVDPRVVRAVGRRGDSSFVLLDVDALLGPFFSVQEEGV